VLSKYRQKHFHDHRLDEIANPAALYTPAVPGCSLSDDQQSDHE